MLKKIGLGLVGLIVVLVVVGFMLPRQVAVERSVVIAAAPEEVFPYVNSLKAFNEWSPWAEYDPDTQYTFSGPETGVGARVDWVSEQSNVGSGSQEIVESVENELVRTKLDFGSEGLADAHFQLKRVDDGTEVTWGFATDMGMNPMGRYFGLMMDKWVGADYERGLDRLKDVVEG